MAKTHLYEALCKFNQGTDDAVCSVRRLKKAPELSKDTYAMGVVDLELRRARVNLQFMTDLNEHEHAEIDHWLEEYDLLVGKGLDHDAVCGLMRVIERERKQHGQPPMVQFLLPDPEERPPQGPSSESNDQNTRAQPVEHETQPAPRPLQSQNDPTATAT